MYATLALSLLRRRHRGAFHPLQLAQPDGTNHQCGPATTSSSDARHHDVFLLGMPIAAAFGNYLSRS